MTSTLNLLGLTLDTFGLTLDPEPHSYLLITAAFVDLPKLTESMARLRATGTAILGIKKATTEERATIATMLERTRHDQDHSRALIRKALDANGGPMDKLEAASLAALLDTQKIAGITDLEFMRIEILRYNAADYLNLSTTAIDAQFALIQTARVEIAPAT